MKYQRMRTGDSIGALSVSTWNAICDAAERGDSIRPFDRTTVERLRGHTGVITIWNNTGTDLDAGSVLSARGYSFTPNTNPSGTSGSDTIERRAARTAQFRSDVAMVGSAPAAFDNTPCVLLEPTPTGYNGLAMLSGVCPARVRMGGISLGYGDGLGKGFAATVSGVMTALRWTGYGNVEILASTPSTNRDAGDANDVGWCYVRVGVPMPEVFTVQLKFNTGSNGDASTACTYAYDMWPINTDTTDTALKLPNGPHQPFRVLPKAAYVAAPDGSLGLARVENRTSDGVTFALLQAYEETLDPGVC